MGRGRTATTLVLAVGCNILGVLEAGAGQGRTILADTLAAARAVADDLGLPLELVAREPTTCIICADPFVGAER